MTVITEALGLLTLGLRIANIATEAAKAAEIGDEKTANVLLARARSDWSAAVADWENAP